jgi:hypothetical protein
LPHTVRFSWRSLALLLFATLPPISTSGCAPDVVEPDGFMRDGAPPGPPVAPERSPTPDGPLTVIPDAAPMDSARVETGPARPPVDSACDLTGRWLVSQRVLAVAIGQQQAAHTWLYYEVRQQGAELVVDRGLHCGFDVVKKTSLAASVDSSAAWPALLQRNSSRGRTGRFTREGDRCRLQFAREYVVRGATLPHYADPTQKLPGRTEQAQGGQPGWEDWDGDGQPGISLKVTSPLASGTLYTCQRDWTEYDGLVEPGARKLKLAVKYGGEQVPLGRSAGAAQAIESSSTPSSDPAAHFVYLHRLDDGQAVGDDAAICEAVRSLRATLAPEADQ